jgi:integrase
MKSITGTQIRAARPKDKAYTLHVERQLFLRVDPNGAKYWIFRYQWGDKQRPMGLGVFPKVSLKKARKDAQKCRAWLDEHKDPILERKLARSRAVAKSEETFEHYAVKFLEHMKPQWKERNYQRQASVLRRCLLPRLGPMPIREIDEPRVLAVLEEAQTQRGISTAYEAQTTCSMVYKFAISRHVGIMHNPARDLAISLQARPQAKHHPALPLDRVGEFLRALSASNTEVVTVEATRLVMLLGLRITTLRTATWREINWDAATWSCPASHMKARKARAQDFATPLPAQALDALKRLHALTFDGRPESHIFAGKGTAHMSHSTINQAIKRLGFVPATCHGFRSLLSSWATEEGYSRECWKRQLAQAVGNATDESYMRSQMWQQRVDMLAHWGRVIEAAEKGKQLAPTSNVRKLRQRSA